MEINRVIQRHHHADPSAVIRRRAAKLLVLFRLLPRNVLEVLLHLLSLGIAALEVPQRVLDGPPIRKAHEIMHAGDRADEVRVAHVRQRGQMRLVIVARLVGALAARHLLLAHVGRTLADPADRAHPLAQLALAGTPALRNGAAHTLERSVVIRGRDCV